MTKPATQLTEYSKKLEEILRLDLLPPKHRGYCPPAQKVIHDALWGSRLFYPWEIALIDTPLLQRLRQIYQLGTAYLTYPSAVHTRFSHTLGVTILAGRLITRLKEKLEIQDSDIQITKKDIYTVRVAGLLHDIGHCFFSHASEKVLQHIMRPILVELGIDAKPHEIIGHLIIKNEYFKEYWNSFILNMFPSAADAPDLDEIAKIIVKIPHSEDRRFIQEIISGPYDVDKLEYLYRDAKTAGLEISYDIERYFYKITIAKSAQTTYRLVMDLGGIRAIEQIIFSKMMLFSFVYHHQKVLATDELVFDMLMELLIEAPKGQININHPLDFLRYTDYDLLSRNLEGPSDKFNRIRRKLIYRDLPKRCFVLNKEFVNNFENDESIKKSYGKLLSKLRGIPDEVNNIRSEVLKILQERFKLSNVSIDDLYVSYPKIPQMDEAASAPVIDSNGEIRAMSEYFHDLEGWQKTYDLKKLRGYFYAKDTIRKQACQAIQIYLDEVFNLKFDQYAMLEAKMNK